MSEKNIVSFNQNYLADAIKYNIIGNMMKNIVLYVLKTCIKE